MKQSIIFLAIIFWTVNGFAQDFRKVIWGMSKDEVMASEPDVSWDVLQDGSIGFPVTVGGDDAYVYYLFTNDMLYQGAYSFTKSHSNDNMYIHDYNRILDILIEKYGLPQREGDRLWRNTTYKNDNQRWGFAVSLGDLSFYSLFDLPDTKIQHVLSGDNYKISHIIYYTSVSHEEIKNKGTDSQNMQDF